MGDTDYELAFERENDGLGGYGSSEQQSMGRIVHFALSKRIEEARRLQSAPWMLCKQMQRSIHSLDFLSPFVSRQKVLIKSFLYYLQQDTLHAIASNKLEGSIVYKNNFVYV
ncbi:hypothetical protein GCM10023231_19580 [Olivibacter ginsenosidimutans]|uniref:Uncharacterized protein n=1 Tax=Olivibacter ginsenosidimutans TaxID=1176537 RepID=A0ABP9B7J9_9SPHI